MNSGFSLIESLVIVSIISIIAALSLTAFPAVRAHQQLVSDTELIKSLLLDSKERALNQVRPEKCLDQFEAGDKARAGCSDVGIAFVGKEIIQFADTTGTTKRYNMGDYTIVRLKLSTKIVTGSVRSLLFYSNPPSVFLHANSVAAMGPQGTAPINLLANNGATRKLEVTQFGTINIVP